MKAKVNKSKQRKRPANSNRTLVQMAPRMGGTLGLPSEMMVDFVFNDLTLNRLSGTQFSYFLMRLGGLYDPDPNLGTGVISTFPEYAKLYNFYQVRSVRINWTVANLDTTPKSCYYYITHAANYPGSVADAVDYAELSNSSSIITLGPATAGNNVKTILSTVPLAPVFGGIQKYSTNSSFYSVVTTVPSSNIVAVFVAYAPATQTLGVYSSLKVTFRAMLWERSNAIS